jgi:hypothetical protein
LVKLSATQTQERIAQVARPRGGEVSRIADIM